MHGSRILILLLAVLTSPVGVLGFPSPADSRPAFDVAGLIDGKASLMDWMEQLADPLAGHDRQSALADEGWRPMTKPRLGYLTHPVWTRLRVTNTGHIPQTIILFNQRPMVQFIDVTILEADHPENEFRLGFYRDAATDTDIEDRLSNFILTVPPGRTFNVLARLDTLGAMEVSWMAATFKTFSSQGRRDILILGICCGVMLALLIHGMSSWLTFREAQFGHFAGYVLCFLLYLAPVNGLTRIIDLGLPPQFWFACSVICVFGSLVFWLAFTKYFLNTRTSMPLMHRWLGLLQSFFAGLVLLYLGAPWFPQIYSLITAWSWCALAVYPTVLAAGFLAVRRQLHFRWLFLLGHAAAFTASGLMAILMHIGPIRDLAPLFMLQPLIFTMHVMVMALSLGILARQARDEMFRQEQAMLEQSRFTALGRTIGALAHQWRAPLARLGAQIAELRAYFASSRPLLDHAPRIRDELLPGMEQGVASMSTQVNDLRDFFSSTRPGEDFDPEQVLNQVLDMLGGRIHAGKVRVERHVPPEPMLMHGHPSALAHVLMVLTGNALEMFAERNIAHPLLRIDLTRDQKAGRVVLTMSDNAGGIAVRPIERIFETFVSEKGAQHMGMGMGIAKKLVEERMGGTIRAENLGPGARFTVRLPIGAPEHRGMSVIPSNGQ